MFGGGLPFAPSSYPLLLAYAVLATRPEALFPDSLLIEVAWEVCNQVGGIYTVIRSKVPATVPAWGGRYCLLGPYFPQQAQGEFESYDDDQLLGMNDPYARAVRELRAQGVDICLGVWLVTGRPRTVLINPFQKYDQLATLKSDLWRDHQIPSPDNDDLLHQVIAFGNLAAQFIETVARQSVDEWRVIGHFHEWMTGVAIPGIAPPPGAGALALHDARHAAGPLPGHERPELLRQPDAGGLARPGPQLQH